MLMRLIFLGLIAYLAYVFWRKYLSLPRTDTPTPPPAKANTQAMRKCAQCGVHVPEGESTQSRGHYFCCEAHRDAFFRGQ